MTRPLAALVLLAAACAARPPAKADLTTKLGPPIPVEVADAAERIEDPLAGVTRARIRARLDRGGPNAASAEWTGWVPIVADSGEKPDLGDMQLVLEMLRARELVLEALRAQGSAARTWSREGLLHRGSSPDGSFVNVRLDERGRIAFVRRAVSRSDAGESMELGYFGKTSRVEQMVVRSGADGVVVVARWESGSDGALSAAAFEMQLAEDRTPLGAIAVVVLELQRRPGP